MSGEGEILFLTRATRRRSMTTGQLSAGVSAERGGSEPIVFRGSERAAIAPPPRRPTHPARKPGMGHSSCSDPVCVDDASMQSDERVPGGFVIEFGCEGSHDR